MENGMKNVIMVIKGTQTVDDAQDAVELTTVGKMGEKNGKIFLTYEEDTEGGAPVTTTLKIIGEESVTMQKSGGNTSRLMIEKGQRNISIYETGYGNLAIGVFGESIKNGLHENGGTLEVSYTLDANSSLLSHNKLEISVKEA